MAVDRFSNNQATSGSGMSTALATSEEDRIKRQQELGEEASTDISSGPSTIGGSSATKTSTPVKAMPKQQKAGTGTFANLKSYLQAAQGGGQQKVAEAATQQVQRLGTGAQKGVQQAQETFRGQLQAGSGAVFQGDGGQGLTQEQAAERARQRAEEAINAARAVTYQAPQEQTEAKTPAQPQQYFTPIQQEQFADIINAQYQGPQSLQQAGLYEPAAQRARAAQQAGKLTQTALGREQLLRDVFGRNRDYSRGASKLDAILLNASEQGVQQLQQQAQPALQAQQALQEAQNISANEAAQRAAAIEQIRSGARQSFTEARSEEELNTQKEIENIQNNWNKLPEYFKNLLMQNAEKPETSRVGNVGGDYANRYYDYFLGKPGAGTNYNLSSEEMRILGLSPGQSLYGITPESIQAAPVAKAEELITKDQLSRQLALAQLAKLDLTNSLQKNLMYDNLEKAGTKDILSSLDTNKLQNTMLESRQNMENELNRLGNIAMATNGAYKAYSYLDLLKAGGYIPTNMEGLVAEDGSNILRNIAEGQTYQTGQTIQNPNVIQKAYQSMSPNIGGNQLVEWGLKPLQNVLNKYGGANRVQQVENEQTAARAAALRALLSDIYKK